MPTSVPLRPVAAPTSLVLLCAALVACAPKVPPVEVAPPPAPSAGLVEVTGMAAKAAPKELLRRVLATAAVGPCYEAALARDPRLYGEVVVRFTALADGRVEGVDVHLSTLGDAAAEACVLDAVRVLPFPGVTTDRLTVVYPFLFTSDATPPEVARALKVRYGLVPTDPGGDSTNPKDETPEGMIYLW
ncbi:MAG: AgmX/PglI C-terminal domain-containing protein [Pseudomonadota bacterium]|nr:AgmX/PglI C-terminal domain-containing protein [Pseudomonadota bacterium]